MTSLTVTSPRDQRLDTLALQLAELTAEIRRQRQEREALRELLADVGPIARQVVDQLTRALERVDAPSYAAFARGTGGVLDRVITSFDEDDLGALGENVVLILETVKEMTQPEVMAMLQRTAHVVRDHTDEPATPPSLLALLRELRDPEVRRGLARTLTLLRSVGHDGAGPTDHEEVAR